MPKLDLRLILVTVGVVIGVAAALTLTYFLRDQPVGALGGGLPGQAEQIALEADGVHVVGHDAGKARWRLAAQTVTLSRDRRTIAINGIHQCILYASTGHSSVTLTASRAAYQTPFGMIGLGSAGLLRVSGNVRAAVQTPAHPRFSTGLLVWDSQTNELSCPGKVSAVLPKLRVTAGSASYASSPDSPAQGTVTLGGGIRAVFDSPHGLATLACPGLVWTAAAGTAKTLGPVSAVIPGGLGTATAAEIVVNTRTGDLTGHGFQGTLRLSSQVQ